MARSFGDEMITSGWNPIEQERAEALALLLALRRERPVGVRAAPRFGIACVGVAEQVQLDGVAHLAVNRD